MAAWMPETRREEKSVVTRSEGRRAMMMEVYSTVMTDRDEVVAE
jgi:hypothetical protein